MTNYFCRYIGEPKEKYHLKTGQFYSINTFQSMVGKFIRVRTDQWFIIYQNLDLFLADWDTFDKEDRAEDTVAGLVASA